MIHKVIPKSTGAGEDLSAPPMVDGSSPVNMGREWVSFPHMSIAIPLIRMLAPMVMMTQDERGEAFLRGADGRSLEQYAATAVVRSIARSVATGSGSFPTERK